MKVFKICYIAEQYPYEIFDDTEIVRAENLVSFVKTMIKNERINPETIDAFKKEHGRGIKSIKDAIELLDLDGYTVGHQEL